ncbi:hypothetical protein NEFER03_1052 [Nematocida sp. LUAm3]|nr:hypothetical protein NEFER03_1052 [Nematocida sp. LUAm3]KAI5175343.1 hypothetical protein NEFER02_1272 [Nematocida sp. LUAm2]KAI5177700.1 hypothetical protein NEFER01_0924 [Nematocida sp. LUAm1]
MRILGSLGLALFLARKISADISQERDFSGAESIEYGYGSGNRPDHFDTMTLKNGQNIAVNQNQKSLIQKWPSLKKASYYAQELGLREAYRVTIYVPIDRNIDPTKFGPNIKLEALNQFISILGSVVPDSPSSIYTSLPDSYQEISKSVSSNGSGSNTSTVTKITTVKEGPGSGSAPGGAGSQPGNAQSTSAPKKAALSGGDNRDEFGE